MKKSLKVIASAAMVFSMFASVAMADTAPASSTTTSTSTTATSAVKTSKDFTDLANANPDLVKKIDALLAKGYMEGASDTTFDVTSNMTRAEAAKLVTKIFGLTPSTATTSSFTDVDANDASIKWSIPFIEAAKTAGIIDGETDTTFAPKDNVTIGQLATMLVKGMGKTVDVSGTPWYANAVSQAQALNILAAGVDGSAFATRTDLVNASYAADGAFQATQKASVTDAKATGVQTVTVNFSKAVDATKATLALTKGNVAIATTAKFADDNKSATLTLTDTKIGAGDYTVTLGGVDNIGTATGSFTGQDESLTKIEFVNAGDVIAQGNHVSVKVKASNQYGEAASFSAGSYTVYPSGATLNKITKGTDGLLYIDLNTQNSTPNVSIASITIVNNDSHVTASKNYTIGTPSIFTKMELGAARYSNGSSVTGSGDAVKYDLNVYDQYGNLIPLDSNDALKATADGGNTSLVWNDYIDANSVSYTVEDNGNGMPELKISLNTNIDKTADYHFTVINQAATATGTVSFQSTKVATKVAIGDFNNVIASGDQDVYIPIVAYDAQGNQLSLDDLTSAANQQRINVTVTGAGVDGNANGGQAQIIGSGEHRGTIHITNVNQPAKGAVTVTAIIAQPNAQSTANRTFTVADARVPDHFRLDTTPASAVAVNGHSTFKYVVVDQYGQVLKTNKIVDGSGNVLPDNATSGFRYQVEIDPTLTGSYEGSNLTGALAFNNGFTVSNEGITTDDDLGSTHAVYAVYAGHPASKEDTVNHTWADFERFNDGFRFVTTDTAATSVRFVARIYKYDISKDTAAATAIAQNKPLPAGWQTEVAKADKTVDVLQQTTDKDLTYSLNDLGSLANVIDSGVTAYSLDTNAANPVSSAFHKEITLTAKNAAGETVGIPHNILSVYSSNQNVVKVAMNGSNQAYAIGNKAGTATINVTYTDNKGAVKQASETVTVKSDALDVATLAAGNSSYTAAARTINAYGAMDLKITDNYGITYDGGANGKIQNYNPIFGVVFTVSHVVGGTTSDVTFNPATGLLNVAANVASFDLTAIAPNGKQVVTGITVPTNVNTIAAPALTATATAVDGNGNTQITAAVGGGDHLAVVVSTAANATPNFGDAAPQAAQAYTSGANLAAVAGKHVGVYELNSANQVVKFVDITLQ